MTKATTATATTASIFEKPFENTKNEITVPTNPQRMNLKKKKPFTTFPFLTH